MKSDSYQSRGVSATKEDVKKAVSGQSRGEYPGSFCQIIPDPAGHSAWCAAMHADGAGTKSSLAYLMYRETGNPGWFAGIAQDSLVMNTDDLLCIGAVDDFYVSNTIGRNAHRIDASCLATLITGYDNVITRLQDAGIRITMTGGETADVGDLVRTVICDSTVFVRLERDKVIDASRIKPGLAIIGLSSTGQAAGETRENSGMGSNGLTAARHLLLHGDYRRRYPESFSDTLSDDKAYSGTWLLTDQLPGTSLSVGEAMLSPTRSYLPVIKDMLNMPEHGIQALIHCTGGGLAKCRDFGHGIRYIKDHLFAIPPLYAAIEASGLISREEMYQVFSMGHRMEIFCDEQSVGQLLNVCVKHNLAAQVIGHTEQASDPNHNTVLIRDGRHVCEYFA